VSPYSSAGIATGCVLDGCDSIPGKGKRCVSIPQCTEFHRASYPLDIKGFFPGVKQPGRETGHSPPSNVEVMNGGAIPSLTNTFMA
jgi:hypothetical protein